MITLRPTENAPADGGLTLSLQSLNQWPAADCELRVRPSRASTLMPNEFGVFAPVFESPHGYLALLHLSAQDSPDAVRFVRQCAVTDSDRSAILQLLKDLNWRPTLVAAVAAAFLPPDPRIIDGLWHRFDSGSWVVPQIAVVLSSIDPNFQTQARHRLEAHCPLDSTELRAMTMLQRHSAAGPAGGTQRSAKAASVLETIVAAISPQPAWLASIVATSEHQALVASDIDRGGNIAERWGERFTQIRRLL